MSSRTKTRSMPKRPDPVLPDQGGRSMPGDPRHVANRPVEEAIRLRAYQLYEERGRVHGHDLKDWFTAEAQIVGSQR